MKKANKEKYYKCEACGLLYKEKAWQEKCQEWCTKYNSCNLEIIKHAISDAQNTS